MKTKIICSAMLFIFLSFFSFAQYIAPEKKWTVAINVNTVEPITEAGFVYIVGQTRIFDPADHKKDNSYSLGLSAAYKIKENCALRLSVKGANYIIDETVDQRETLPFTGNDYLIDDGHIRQSVYSFSSGILWNSNYKKLDFYGGFQMVYRYYSPAIITLNYHDYTSLTNALLLERDYVFKNDGGFSIGIGPIAGFSVNVFKGLSIGAEFSMAYTYYKTGGEINWSETFIHPPPQPITTAGVGLQMPSSYEAFKFSSLLSSINIAFSF
jgi:hypothetical protein